MAATLTPEQAKQRLAQIEEELTTLRSGLGRPRGTRTPQPGATSTGARPATRAEARALRRSLEQDHEPQDLTDEIDDLDDDPSGVHLHDEDLVTEAALDEDGDVATAAEDTDGTGDIAEAAALDADDDDSAAIKEALSHDADESVAPDALAAEPSDEQQPETSDDIPAEELEEDPEEVHHPQDLAAEQQRLSSAPTPAVQALAFIVPAGDTTVADWWNAQRDPSSSVLSLISHFVAAHGNTDAADHDHASPVLSPEREADEPSLEQDVPPAEDEEDVLDPAVEEDVDELAQDADTADDQAIEPGLPGIDDPGWHLEVDEDEADAAPAENADESDEAEPAIGGVRIPFASPDTELDAIWLENQLLDGLLTDEIDDVLESDVSALISAAAEAIATASTVIDEEGALPEVIDEAVAHARTAGIAAAEAFTEDLGVEASPELDLRALRDAQHEYRAAAGGFGGDIHQRFPRRFAAGEVEGIVARAEDKQTPAAAPGPIIPDGVAPVSTNAEQQETPAASQAEVLEHTESAVETEVAHDDASEVDQDEAAPDTEARFDQENQGTAADGADGAEHNVTEG